MFAGYVRRLENREGPAKAFNGIDVDIDTPKLLPKVLREPFVHGIKVGRLGNSQNSRRRPELCFRGRRAHPRKHVGKRRDEVGHVRVCKRISGGNQHGMNRV